jgi:hypothetical protein
VVAQVDILFAAQQIRISRPTNRLDELKRFYCMGLGLDELLSFEPDRAGYGGVVLGAPGLGFHLELCTHLSGFPTVRPPTEDNLLVFYLDDTGAVERLANRMGDLGYRSVPARNPHWDQDGVTFEDPDGWRVVLMRRSNI